ncbi:O-antigen ligase family protein [Nostoc sp. CMAA1605]|uniref:O-antigen ligase family protein n=1 Tax=Nostoc sp. CMAA1605 TaxID=2055159 RepID=UPI001F42A08A|nr:O-antigen ligase family protein [Nostoc sp. CMAA1605]MCF4969336.1 polymerase [Nostoc sp. CMAA1605]
MLGVSLKLGFDRYSPHNLQLPWKLLQIGLLIFPLSPFLGAVSIGFATLFSWLRQNRKIIHTSINQGFAVFTILLLISSSLAVDKPAAFIGLFNLLPFFLVFAGLSALIQTGNQLKRLAWIFVIGSVPVLIMGFGQLFFGWTSQLQILVLDVAIASGGSPPGRMSSIFMHANIFAAYLAIVFTLGLGLLLERGIGDTSTSSVLRWVLGTGRTRKSLNPYLLLPLILVADFAALILTNSRNGWAIAIVACLAFALYQGWRLLVGAVTGIVASVLLAAFAPAPVAQLFRRIVPAFFWARLNDELYPDRPVALMRKTQWQFAWSLTQQHPWTGWGLRNFSALYKAHMNIDLGHPHNLFLMLSAETGLPATLLFFGLLGWILFSGIQLLQKSHSLITENRVIIFSYLVVLMEWLLFNTVDVTLFDFRLNTISWLLLAAVSGITYHYHQHDARKHEIGDRKQG